MGFLSRSLFTRLIAIRSVDRTLGLLEAGAQCTLQEMVGGGFLSHSLSIAVAIRSLDPTHSS